MTIDHSNSQSDANKWGYGVQVTQILDERTKLLARMANLSGVRNHLALHAVGILVPSRHRPSSHPSQEARLQSLEVGHQLPQCMPPCCTASVFLACSCCTLNPKPKQRRIFSQYLLVLLATSACRALQSCFSIVLCAPVIIRVPEIGCESMNVLTVCMKRCSRAVLHVIEVN